VTRTVVLGAILLAPLGLVAADDLVRGDPQGVASFATELHPGRRLRYEGNGQPQPPWVIDSVQREVAHAGRQGCVRVVLRTRGDSAAAEARLHCVAGDTLLVWSAQGGQFRAQRPLTPGRQLTVGGASGTSQEITTGAVEVDTIDAHRVVVVPTVLVTRGADGQPLRRLTERYAPSLATATAGVFETADSTAASGWRVVQRFALVGISP
jgi:hypothetical protein